MVCGKFLNVGKSGWNIVRFIFSSVFMKSVEFVFEILLGTFLIIIVLLFRKLSEFLRELLQREDRIGKIFRRFCLFICLSWEIVVFFSYRFLFFGLLKRLIISCHRTTRDVFDFDEIDSITDHFNPSHFENI